LSPILLHEVEMQR